MECGAAFCKLHMFFMISFVSSLSRGRRFTFRAVQFVCLDTGRSPFRRKEQILLHEPSSFSSFTSMYGLKSQSSSNLFRSHFYRQIALRNRTSSRFNYFSTFDNAFYQSYSPRLSYVFVHSQNAVLFAFSICFPPTSHVIGQLLFTSSLSISKLIRIFKQKRTHSCVHVIVYILLLYVQTIMHYSFCLRILLFLLLTSVTRLTFPLMLRMPFHRQIASFHCTVCLFHRDFSDLIPTFTTESRMLCLLAWVQFHDWHMN